MLSSREASESYVLFADDDADNGSGDSSEHVVALVVVRRVADIDVRSESGSGSTDGGNSEAVVAAVDAMGVHAAERRGRQWLDIDDERVLREEFRYPNGLPGSPGADSAVLGSGSAAARFLAGDIAVVFAAVAFGGALVSVSAIAPWPATDERRAEFTAALESMRCITTGGV